MSASRGRNTEQQKVFIRQSTILRKNLSEWDRMLHDPRGEDWPTMLGRLNAAMNQTASMDRNIEDVMEHFCYLPKQCTANAQDIPFFLSTRLETPATEETTSSKAASEKEAGNPTQLLAQYENRAAQLASEYEDQMVRF
ncbi:expressed unknown protein [Seminavis robusta]|uniref:Uncharacterized protein n=1 Tax=Seminavis robusta TaxID=568900 RepID=A0A9N8DGN9_9STRA|nr:expressed unknown protein [Seminavis robusta]|eukprot:Sro142_g066440.1 n/a (139) ;mRNA; r:103949-104456